MAQNRAVPTTDEVVALLSKSSLPTVVIEGNDDVVVYRKMEEIFFESGLSVLPVGGRKNVLKIFDQLSEISTRKNLAFIADRDLWVVSSVPEEYVSKQIIFTEGYSIGNDVLRDCNVKEVMSRFEREKFSVEVDKYAYWYSLMVRRALDGRPDADLKFFPGRVLDSEEEFQLRTTLDAGEIYPQEIYELVKSDGMRYVRGKSLVQIVARQLLHHSRDPKVNPAVFMGVAAARPGPLLSRIFDGVSEFFSPTGLVEVAAE